jgi:hypothetical protein
VSPTDNHELTESRTGSELEDAIAETFRQRGYITFTRTNRCDIVAVKPDGSLAFIVEAKDWDLKRKAQVLAVRQLNRNYTRALEVLVERGIQARQMKKLLVARSFAYQSRNIYQFTPDSFTSFFGDEED